MLRAFWTNHKRYVLCVILAFSLTTWPVITDGPIDWDSAQYLLGVEHFSVAMHQPHPPGYPLFIVFGKVLALLFSPYTSLLIMNSVFSISAVFGIYLLVWRIWQHRWLAATLSTAFMVNPIFWFYRGFANTYVIDTALSIWLALLTYCFIRGLTEKPNAQYLYASAVVLGVGSGFRPSLLVLLMPLFVLQLMYYANKRARTISVSILVLSVVLWLVPLMIVSGGIGGYFQSSLKLYGDAAHSSSYFFGASPRDAINGIRHFVITTIVSLNWLLLPIVVSILLFGRDVIWKRWKIHRFYLWWIMAWIGLPIVVYSFIHFGQIGYVLTVLPAGYILAARGAEWLYYEFYRQSSMYLKMLGVTIFIVIILGQITSFLLFTPVYAHPDFIPTRRIDLLLQTLTRFAPALSKTNFSFLVESDARVQRLVSLIQQHPPENTLVITGRDVLYPATRTHLPMRNDEIFRELSATLTPYQVIQLQPNSEKYLSAKNAQTHKVMSKLIEVDNSIQYVIFVFDELSIEQKPQHIVVEKYKLSPNQSYYIGSMDWPFQFLGYTIQHERD